MSRDIYAVLRDFFCVCFQGKEVAALEINVENTEMNSVSVYR